MDRDSAGSGDPAPYFKTHVFVCTNDRGAEAARPSCARSGSEKLRDYMKAQARAAGLAGIRINAAGCLDRCELGCTLVIYPEGVWYHYDTRADIDEIIETHLKQGGRVGRLLLTPDQAETLRPGQKTGPV
jgi:(2Fe-2S) ferredoxin